MTAEQVQELVDARRGAWVARGLAGPTSDELRGICRAAHWRFVEVDLHGATDKLSLMRTLAEQFDFPDHFGGNWDAVNDCLADLADGWAGVVVRLKGLSHVPELLAEPFVHILDGEVTGSVWGEDPREASKGAWAPFVVVADPPLPSRH